jgi:MoaA/NifB/PqqE/SkfB family radical SAM enzyme
MNPDFEKQRNTDIVQERLSIEVTTRCNIDCSHCFARVGISESSSLSLGVAKEIIAEGYHLGYRHLHITGGEPLIWKDLFAALDYAYDVGHQTVFLNTNGTLFSADLTSRLAAYNGLTVSVSLEGGEALHENLRGQGSYLRTVHGIQKALDAGVDLAIFSIACKSLLSKLPRFADDLYKKFPAVSYLTLLQLVPVANGVFALSDELLEPEDLLKLIEMVSLLNLLGLKTRLLYNPLAYVASKLLKFYWIPQSPPLYSEGSIIIMANRDIGLSHSSRKSFGKYDSGMIGKVLTSDAYRKAIAPDEKTCPSCKYTEFCMENGMGRPSESYWDIQSDGHFCQDVLDRVLT